jgi:hypothetical protein
MAGEGVDRVGGALGRHRPRARWHPGRRRDRIELRAEFALHVEANSARMIAGRGQRAVVALIVVSAERSRRKSLASARHPTRST